MKPAIYRRNSWLPTNGWFPTVFDEFLNNDMLNTASNVAPSVNVKETANSYTVELAAPGVKKEYCRVHVDEDHNLCVAIENKFEHKEEDKHAHYLRREALERVSVLHRRPALPRERFFSHHQPACQLLQAPGARL